MECILINSSSLINEKVFDSWEAHVYYTNGRFDNLRNSSLIELDEKVKKEINFDAFNKVIYWGEKEVNNQSVNEILSIEGFNFWQYNKFRIYFHVRNILYEIELIKNLKAKGYKSVILYSDYQYEIQHLVNGINVKRGYFKKPKKLNKYITLAKYLFVFMYRAMSDFFKLGDNIKHLIVDSSILQPCVRHDGKIDYDNYSLVYLFDRLNKDFAILDELIPPKLTERFSINESLKRKKRDIKTINTDSIIFKGLLSSSIRKKYKEISKEILAKLRLLNSSMNSSVDNLVIESIFTFFPSNKMFLLRYLSFQSFFYKHNYLSVTATDENGPVSRSILDAAKSLSIKVVGIQHGAIHKLHPNYIFSKKEQGCVPDYTFVWGKKWAELLVDFGHYKIESLIITGQIRTDIIPYLARNNKSDLYNVVYASQPQRDSILREKTAMDIMNAIKELPDCKLVIKLHPKEINDENYYNRLAEKVGIDNIIILKQSELYITLAQSDIVITSFSTVGTEAIYFNKPLIIYDPLHQDVQNYIKEGVALKAVNSDDVRKYIIGYKEGSLLIDKEKYKKFIEYNAFRIDGHVVDRCLEFYHSL